MRSKDTVTAEAAQRCIAFGFTNRAHAIREATDGVVNSGTESSPVVVLRREGKPAMHGVMRRTAIRVRLSLALAICALMVVSTAGGAVSPAAARSIGAVGADFDPPTYVQQRNLSCEYASLVIAFGTYGVSVSEYAFDDLVGWSDNP